MNMMLRFFFGLACGDEIWDEVTMAGLVQDGAGVKGGRERIKANLGAGRDALRCFEFLFYGAFCQDLGK